MCSIAIHQPSILPVVSGQLVYCKVRNIGVEQLLATLVGGSDSLILRSVYICSIFQRFFILHRPLCLEAMCTSNLPWRRIVFRWIATRLVSLLLIT